MGRAMARFVCPAARQDGAATNTNCCNLFLRAGVNDAEQQVAMSNASKQAACIELNSYFFVVFYISACQAVAASGFDVLREPMCTA